MSITIRRVVVSKRYLLPILLILLTGIATAGYFLFIKDDKPQPMTTQQTLDKVLTSRQKGGNDAKSKEELLAALARNPNDPQERYKLKVTLASIYRTEGNFDEAKKIYDEALKEIPVPNYNDYMSLGDIALKQGDKTAAIDYYKKALVALEKSVDSADKVGRMEYLRLTIDQLEKS